MINFIFGEGDFEDMIFFIFGFDLVFVSRLHDKLNSGFFGADEVGMQADEIDKPATGDAGYEDGQNAAGKNHIRGILFHFYLT